MKDILLSRKALIIAAICVLTFICFSYTLNNQFTNWDDDYYVTNDPYIRSFSAENLKTIFTQDITKNNYHPLCMLSLAINYHFAQLNPWSYYLTNVLIHILNVVLVFLLVLGITRRMKLNDGSQLFIASFTALLFGVHPMHVESVAWIAERKDVLYACFYVLGMLSWLRYIDEQKMKWLWITLGLFALSCLSKPMAVVFPVSLLFLDFLLKRPLTKKLITEKVLFFAVSLICGGFAFYTQNRTGAIADFGRLSIGERVMYASYGFIMYIAKLFNPTYLSTFYPYPYRLIGTNNLPTIYYAAPFIAIGVVAAPIYIAYKLSKEYFRVAVFGLGYLFANLVFVLQFISCGAAIMADRYSYVSYIGLLFMVIYFINELIQRSPSLKVPVLAVMLLASGGLAYGCYQRTYAWHDSETLLSDAIEKYPLRAWLSYKWLGNYYFEKGEYDKALENYKILEMLGQKDNRVASKMELIANMKGGGAMMPLSATGTPHGNPQPYIDSTVAYCRLGDTTLGFRSYILGIKQNPTTERILADSFFSQVQRQDYVTCVNGYNVLLKLNTGNAYYYFYRGTALYGLGKMDAAIADWETGVKMNVKDVQMSGANNLSVAYDQKGNHEMALHYALMAKKLGYNVTDDFINKLRQKARK